MRTEANDGSRDIGAKMILEFNLDTHSYEAKAAMNGANAISLLWEIQQALWRNAKHTSSLDEDTTVYWSPAYDLVNSMINDSGLGDLIYV